MNEENISPDEAIPRWFIDLDWFKLNKRSFSTLAEWCLCAGCRQRLKVGEEEIPAGELLAAIKDCCSQEPRFITGELPILESIFRLFLANANQPLTLEELGRQLSQRWSGNPYRISLGILSRLLEDDRYYGLRRVAGSG